jgi:hypothetical protein
VQKNIIFNRFGIKTEWHKTLSFNQMAGILLMNSTALNPVKVMS